MSGNVDRRRRAIDPISLRFIDASTEQRFRRSRARSDLRYARRVLWLVIVFAVPFALYNFRLTDASLRPYYVWGHTFEMAVFAGLLALTYLPGLLGRHMALMAPLAVFLVVVYAGWNWLLGVPDIYVMSGVLLLVAIYALLPLDFVWGTATALVCSAIYLAISAATQPMPASSLTIVALFAVGANAIGALSLHHVERLRRIDFANIEEIDAQRRRHSDLLARILPQAVADRLQRGESGIADRFDDVTVLFADLVGFTGIAARRPPEQVVAILETVFGAFDSLAERHGVEKIKTVGDAYMAVAGVPTRRADHASVVADLALAMAAEVRRLQLPDGVDLDVRIGISSGPVVAGVIGERRFAYDLWGDTVNVASRMEEFGEPGRIQLSEATYRRLADDYEMDSRAEVEIKGLGRVPTWYLLWRRSAGPERAIAASGEDSGALGRTVAERPKQVNDLTRW